MSEEKDLLKYAFEGIPTVFQALAGRRTQRVFKGELAELGIDGCGTKGN